MKKILFTLILYFSFIVYKGNAQTLRWQWAKNEGASMYDFAISIAVDDSGNSYLIGSFQGSGISSFSSPFFKALKIPSIFFPPAVA